VWVLAFGLAAHGADKPVVEIRAGERIAFVGNDFFDRELGKGYIETQVASRFYDKGVTFRNLGYGGDTVWCQARNLCSGWDQFGPPDQGFKRLQKLVEEFSPTVVFVAYGMSESFEGPGGLEHFTRGLNRLLDMLSRSDKSESTTQAVGKVRIVLVSPIRHEDLGAPLPDPSEHNRNLRLYVEAMQKVAASRKCAMINLFDTLSEVADPQARLTSDGIHLTAYGYWRAAAAIEGAMGYEPRRWRVELDAKEGTPRAEGARVSDVGRGKTSVSFRSRDSVLPVLPPLQGTPGDVLDGRAVAPGQERTLKVTGLAPGRYELKSEGQTICVAGAEEWGRGVQLLTSPNDKQAEDLRERVVAKDFDYFNYWRPENDTYIFGYRKHEQGRNAVEVPNFLSRVRDKEAQVAAVAAPDVHTYELTRSAGK
jgi:hypothetical protein